jgi:hypothetical protein
MTDNIAFLRLTEKNNIQSEILSLNAKISRSESALTELRKNKSINDREYIDKQRKDNQDTIDVCREKIAALEERMELVTSGQIDDDIIDKLKQSTESVKRVERETEQKKMTIKKREDQNKVISNQYERMVRQSDYQNRREQYSSSNDYERFRNIANNPPRWMEDQLRRMPNNKGFIWKDIWFFGECDPDSDIVEMTDHQYGGKTLIREYTDTCVNVYEKGRNGDDRLLSSTPRNRQRRRY